MTIPLNCGGNNEILRRPYCERKHCKEQAIGLVEVDGVRWLVCAHHARQHGVSDEEIEQVKETWTASGRDNTEGTK